MTEFSHSFHQSIHLRFDTGLENTSFKVSPAVETDAWSWSTSSAGTAANPWFCVRNAVFAQGHICYDSLQDTAKVAVLYPVNGCPLELSSQFCIILPSLSSFLVSLNSHLISDCYSLGPYTCKGEVFTLPTLSYLTIPLKDVKKLYEETKKSFTSKMYILALRSCL